jgi:hypothetical protein
MLNTKQPMELPMQIQIGLCSVCGARMAIGGGKQVGGYFIPTHYSSDHEEAMLGRDCLGSREPPSALVD